MMDPKSVIQPGWGGQVTQDTTLPPTPPLLPLRSCGPSSGGQRGAGLEWFIQKQSVGTCGLERCPAVSDPATVLPQLLGVKLWTPLVLGGY